MSSYKNVILEKLCYKELFYGRINKKLEVNLSKDKIEKLITTVIMKKIEQDFIKKGKNIYITNENRNIMLTINSYTNRIITTDKLNKKYKN